MNKLSTAAKPNPKKGGIPGKARGVNTSTANSTCHSGSCGQQGVKGRGKGGLAKGGGSPPTSAKMSLGDKQIELPKNEHETRGESGRELGGEKLATERKP